MKNILIAVIILSLAVAAYFLFQIRKKVEAPVPAPALPIEEPPPMTPEDLEYLETHKAHLKELEPALKRQKVYAGATNVRPPCPPDTHEKDGFCHKSSEKFIGIKTVEVDTSCRPDQCDAQCEKACEDATGEECMLREEISRVCLENHPPEVAASTEAELREQGIECRDRHTEYSQRYRCTFTTSEHEEFRYIRRASDEECQQMYEAEQQCQANLPKEKVSSDPRMPLTDAEMRCTHLSNNKFSQSHCEMAQREDGQFYGRASKDIITCKYSCR